MQALLRQVVAEQKELKPRVLKLWQDVVSDNSSALRGFQLAEYQDEILSSPKLHIVIDGLTLTTSLLAATLLMNKFDYFLELFPFCWRQARREISKNENYSIRINTRTSVRPDGTFLKQPLWSTLFEHPELVWRGFSADNLKLLVNVFQKFQIITSRNISDVTEATLLEYLSQFVNISTVIQQLKHIPPLSVKVIQALEPQHLQTDKRLWNQVFLNAIYSRRELTDFPALPFQQYVDRKIRPFMTKLSRSTRKRKRVKKPAKKGFAFELYDILSVTKGHIIFSLLGQLFSVYVTAEYHDTLFQNGNNSFIFIKHKACLEFCHPELRDLMKKYHYIVPRLKFNNTQSDGILIRSDMVKEYIKLTGGNGVDLTADLNIYKIVKSRSFPTPRTPFFDEAWLKRPDLALFAKYQEFDFTQRTYFYQLFWNISLGVDRQEFSRFAQGLLTWLMDQDSQLRKKWLKRQSRRFWMYCLSMIQKTEPALHAMITLGIDNIRNILPKVSVCCLTNPLVALEILKLHAKYPTSFPLQYRWENAIFEEKHLLRMLKTVNVPIILKRVLWQALVDIDANISRPKTNVIEEFLGVTWPELHVDIHVFHDPQLLILFDRETGTLQGNALGVQAQEFDVAIKNEPARGIAVCQEVVYEMWNFLIRKRVIIPYENNDGEVSFCLASDYEGNYSDHIMKLGFISAYCLARGFFLPFPLHIGWWRYLMISPKVIAKAVCFQERMAQMLPHMESQTNEEIQFLLNLNEDEVNFCTRSDLIEQHYLPRNQDLNLFFIGWGSIIFNKLCESLLSEANAMFVQPGIQNISSASFLSHFQSDHPLDDIFAKYVQTLVPHKLERLVEFITGKKRLPLTAFGEDKISTYWNFNLNMLPQAQNCTHTLIMPGHFLFGELSVDRMAEAFRCIFEFETGFGFL